MKKTKKEKGTNWGPEGLKTLRSFILRYKLKVEEKL